MGRGALFTGTRAGTVKRFLVAWSTGALLGAAFYLLLIDITTLPELLVLVVAAVLAGFAAAAARETGFGGPAAPAHWLRQGWRPLSRIPVHSVLVIGEGLRQLASPRTSRGRFLAIPLDGGRNVREPSGQAAIELLGSLAPSTIVIGIDSQRDLLLVHQLGGEAAPAPGLELVGLR